jgi:hypothetical protein
MSKDKLSPREISEANRFSQSMQKAFDASRSGHLPVSQATPVRPPIRPTLTPEEVSRVNRFSSSISRAFNEMPKPKR